MEALQKAFAYPLNDCLLLAALIASASAAAVVPQQLVTAVVQVESSCRHRIVHPVSGAVGLGQILPWWLRTNLAAKCGTDLRNARVNLCYTTRILRYEYARHRTWHRALRYYSGNAPGYVAKIIRAMQRNKHI